MARKKTNGDEDKKEGEKDGEERRMSFREVRFIVIDAKRFQRMRFSPVTDLRDGKMKCDRPKKVLHR